MNRYERIASRVATKFDTRKELQKYRQEHDITPGTKLQVRTEQEKRERNKDRAGRVAAIDLGPENKSGKFVITNQYFNSRLFTLDWKAVRDEENKVENNVKDAEQGLAEAQSRLSEAFRLQKMHYTKAATAVDTLQKVAVEFAAAASKQAGLKFTAHKNSAEEWEVDMEEWGKEGAFGPWFGPWFNRMMEKYDVEVFD